MLLIAHESRMGLADPEYYVIRRGVHYEYAITPGFKTCGAGAYVVGIGLEVPADQGLYPAVYGMARSGLGPLASGRRGLKDRLRRSAAIALRKLCKSYCAAHLLCRVLARRSPIYVICLATRSAALRI